MSIANGVIEEASGAYSCFPSVVHIAIYSCGIECPATVSFLPCILQSSLMFPEVSQYVHGSSSDTMSVSAHSFLPNSCDQDMVFRVRSLLIKDLYRLP